ncbi:transcriptional regulator, Fis family [Lactobacillus paragasseri JV-V03]|uniref:Transcriptional regulator, Fis family n=2 Tax=Lactobacillus paragasseri TaxID=2107999 RepID=A0AA87DDL7_9LACO|nr:transcriptional regulator, Fis family [Lactobacillus paragasseri JV-V03]
MIKMQVSIPERVIERAIQQQYFNKTEAANFLGISKSTFRIWLTKFDFKPISIDGQLLYDKEVLKKFMEEHKL